MFLGGKPLQLRFTFLVIARVCAGSREGKGAVQKMVPGSAVGSISETVKMRASIPCLIIRPSVRLSPIMEFALFVHHALHKSPTIQEQCRAQNMLS